MNPLVKLLRADAGRRTRFHTCRDELCLQPWDLAIAFATTLWRRTTGQFAPIPWIALPAYRYLKQRVRRGQEVYEYSTGMSTLWFARRGLRVHAVEDDERWFRRMVEETRPFENVTLRFAPEREEYVASIGAFGRDRFDLVSIDGSHRDACLREALPRVKPGGLLLVDNTDVHDHRPLVDVVREHWGRESVRLLAGFPAGNLHPQETLIAVRPRPS